ncbi:MAG: DUF305 domain-containing protein [Chitinophagaceae bacterium]|nr:DUF305 domain-containing protein [Oligoflexus sp.]
MKKVAIALGLILGLSNLARAQNSTQQMGMPSSSAEMGMHQAMTTMCQSMDSMQMSGDIEKDFVMMMIPHHQSAVDMATAYLREGKDPELVMMAKKIIVDQNKEIASMKAWLSAHQTSQPVSTN